MGHTHQVLTCPTVADDEENDIEGRDCDADLAVTIEDVQ